MRWAVPGAYVVVLPLAVGGMVADAARPLAERWREAAGRGEAEHSLFEAPLGLEGVAVLVGTVLGLLALGSLLGWLWRAMRAAVEGGEDPSSPLPQAAGPAARVVAAPADERVVIRSPLWMRLLGVPLSLVLWWGIVLAIVGLVRDGGGPDTPWPALVLGWGLCLLLALVLPAAVWFLLRYRVELDGVTGRVRRSPGGVDVGVDELDRLVVLEPSSVSRATRGWRVQLVHPTAGVVGQLSEGDRGWPRALGVLRGWARRRPALVRDDTTRRLLLPDGGEAPLPAPGPHDATPGHP